MRPCGRRPHDQSKPTPAARSSREHSRTLARRRPWPAWTCNLARQSGLRGAVIMPPCGRGGSRLVVGGGIAGGALATVMARNGADVIVLERQSHYRDHVRGELLWPWGVKVAEDLGLESTFLEAGARVVRTMIAFDEGSEHPETDDAAVVIAGVGGSVNLAHPVACAGLLSAASSAGADIRVGVGDVRLSLEPKPVVRWLDASRTPREVTAPLIVGSDGRHSAIRSQASIPSRWIRLRIRLQGCSSRASRATEPGRARVRRAVPRVSAERRADAPLFQLPRGSARPLPRTRCGEAVPGRVEPRLPERRSRMALGIACRAVCHVSRCRQPRRSPTRRGCRVDRRCGWIRESASRPGPLDGTQRRARRIAGAARRIAESRCAWRVRPRSSRTAEARKPRNDRHGVGE